MRVGMVLAFAAAACGRIDHACAALVTGDLYCWGRGDAGQLGDGRSTSSVIPVKVEVP